MKNTTSTGEQILSPQWIDGFVDELNMFGKRIEIFDCHLLEQFQIPNHQERFVVHVKKSQVPEELLIHYYYCASWETVNVKYLSCGKRLYSCWTRSAKGTFLETEGHKLPKNGIGGTYLTFLTFQNLCFCHTCRKTSAAKTASIATSILLLNTVVLCNELGVILSEIIASSALVCALDFLI